MRRLIYVCNAIDDETRLVRKIMTDSPASTRKVLLTCKALNQTEVRPIILSIGRGRPDGSLCYFPAHVSRFQGIPIIYAPFVQIRFISELLSLFWPLVIVLRFKRRKDQNVFLFWNRTLAYIPSLILARLLKMRTVLDLEDGNVIEEQSSIQFLGIRLKTKIYDLFSSLALVTCNPLKKDLRIKKVMCYYGTVENPGPKTIIENKSAISFLLGGTISIDTGSLLVIETVKVLRASNEDWCKNINFVITGKGDCIDELKELEKISIHPLVIVHGRTSNVEYEKILNSCHVGLALKPKSGGLADTTFPSKVVELANAGLLVLTTDISDVRLVLGDGALYTNSETDDFIKLIRWIYYNPDKAKKIAQMGNENVWNLCSVNVAGKELNNFLFN